MREHIHAAHLIHLISCCLDRFQIPRKAGWFAGHINHVADAKIQNLSDRLRMDSVARRIQNDQIRLFFQLVHHLEDIPRQKFAVANSVARRILTGCLDCFPDNLHADYFLRHRCEDLRDRAGAAVKVKYDFSLRLTHILTRFLVQHLRAQ